MIDPDLALHCQRMNTEPSHRKWIMYGGSGQLIRLVDTPRPTTWSETELASLDQRDDPVLHRFLAVASLLDGPVLLRRWIGARTDPMDGLRRLTSTWFVEGFGFPDVLQALNHLVVDGVIGELVHRWILERPTEDLLRIPDAKAEVVTLIRKHCPERLSELFCRSDLANRDDFRLIRNLLPILQEDPILVADIAIELAERMKRIALCFPLLQPLAALRPELKPNIESAAVQAALDSAWELWGWDYSTPAEAHLWLLRNTGGRAAEILADIWSRPLSDMGCFSVRNRVEAIRMVLKERPSLSPETMVAALRGTVAGGLVAVEGMLANRAPILVTVDAIRTLDERCRAWTAQAESFMNEAPYPNGFAKIIAKSSHLADVLRDDGLRWLASDHLPIRRAAAIMLAALGEALPPLVAEALAAKSGDVRLAAVQALAQAATPGCLAALEAHVAGERSDEIRDAA